MITRVSALLVLLAVVGAPPVAQSASDGARERKVDAYVQAQMGRFHVPGVSVAVVKDGRVVLAKGYGLANVELAVRATKETVYELLSVSKQFTAAALSLLVEEGKVGLDEKVSRYLPDAPAAWEAVTVRHLLTHTSGIPDYTDVRGFFENIRQDATPEEQIAPVREKPLQFTPGARFRYSNANYYLLGMILERVSGKPYAAFLRERIFEPLGMTATRVNNLTDIIPNRAAGYHWLDEQADQPGGLPPFLSGYHGVKNVLQNAISVSPTRKWAAGAVLSTVVDLAKWDQALYTEKLLKKRHIEQMMTPPKLTTGEDAPYGFGSELRRLRGHRITGHQGGGMAFNATLYRFPDDKLAVIVLCNQTTAPSESMASRIASFYLPALAEVEVKGIEDREPQVTAMLKGMLLSAAQGKADKSLFSPDAQQGAAFVRRAGPQLLGPLGELKSFVLLERREEGEQRVYRYRAVFGDTPLVWTFRLTREGKILSLEPQRE